MESLNKSNYDIMCNKSAVATFGCLWGISQTVKLNHASLEKMIKNPLSSIFYSAATGLAYSCGATVVASLLPTKLRGLVSIACCLAIGYQKGQELEPFISKITALSSGESSQVAVVTSSSGQSRQVAVAVASSSSSQVAVASLSDELGQSVAVVASSSNQTGLEEEESESELEEDIIASAPSINSLYPNLDEMIYDIKYNKKKERDDIVESADY